MKKLIGVMALACAALFANAAQAAESGSNAADASAYGDGIHANDWLVRLRAISIEPQVSAGGALGTFGVDVNNALVPELDFTYMIRDDIGVELILGTSCHQVTSNIGNLGGVGVLPPTLLLQYHFNHAGRVRPYVGAGLNYTYFYNDKLKAGDTPVSIKRSSFGPALQAGVDVQVARNLFVNADIKKIWMRTSASAGGTDLGSLKIDPWVIGLGVGMKF
ncbi:Outer membrane protein W precursor [Candidatus Burkholderia verschuerenii]|uniref:Outer membrane protein W n=1 Tax=Candidatus Burkholderia verschuerenii TaxID=242163 RepID=A0A0L0M8N9_9BURK|nr:OmpW family outer membrane protein [Candidatus Burkholderia verschuerenii]KND58641.1 Outer membrane protein W precursor [Candidatus Burkholderia verschuerenii]